MHTRFRGKLRKEHRRPPSSTAGAQSAALRGADPDLVKCEPLPASLPAPGKPGPEVRQAPLPPFGASRSHVRRLHGVGRKHPQAFPPWKQDDSRVRVTDRPGRCPESGILMAAPMRVLRPTATAGARPPPTRRDRCQVRARCTRGWRRHGRVPSPLGCVLTTEKRA